MQNYDGGCQDSSFLLQFQIPCKGTVVIRFDSNPNQHNASEFCALEQS